MKIFFSRGCTPSKIQLFSKIAFALEEKGPECIHLSFNDIEKYLYKKYDRKTLKLKKLVDNLNEFNYYKNFSELEIDEMIRFEKEYNLKLFKESNEKKLKNLVKIFLEVLRSLDEKDNIDIFILWNNNFLFDRVAYYYAKKNNKKTYIMEQGYFRPFTLSFDSKGVNNESSIPKSREFFENVVIKRELMEQFLDAPLEATEVKDIPYSLKAYKLYILKNRVVKLFCGDKYEANFISKRVNLKKMFVKKSNKILTQVDFNKKEDYIFVPFQVETDSQLILNSPNIKKMEHLVKEVIKAVEKYNEKNKKTYKIFFKTHPKDFNVNKAKLEEIIKNNKIANIFEVGNTDEFIKNSKLVITINSTVGIEALREGKPVITLGDTFYNIDGIVNHCKDLNNLSECINESLNSQKNIELTNKFLYYLRFKYFKEVFWENANMSSIRKIAKEIA